MFPKRPSLPGAMTFSLWLLVIPTSLVALGFLVAGLAFDSTLWDVRDPGPTIFWLAMIGFPIGLLAGLVAARRLPKALPVVFCVGWAAGTFWCWWVVGHLLMT